jgi:hypothetical protein
MSLNYSFYSDLFLVNDIDLVMFSTMTDQDLVSIGINSFGARKIMLHAIQGELLLHCFSLKNSTCSLKIIID